MARRKGTPALTGKRVWKALRDGSLEAKEMPGTRVLQVSKGRIRLTWTSGGKKKHARIRLNKKYLNPRWVYLPKDYPIPISSLRKMTDDELIALGIGRTKKGALKLLIFQQLDDLASLKRQLVDHTKTRYVKETEELWNTLEKASSREPLKAAELAALTGVVLDRIEEIDVITTHLTGREKGVELRLNRLNKVQKHVKGALETRLRMALKDGTSEINGTSKSLITHLSSHYETLEYLLDDKPFAHHARWARYHIKRAQESLSADDFKVACKYMQKAIDWL